MKDLNVALAEEGVRAGKVVDWPPVSQDVSKLDVTADHPGRRRWPWIGALGALIAVVVLYAEHPVVLRVLAGYLVVEQPLEKADAILVLSGGTPFRAMEAAELYRRGWAPTVILTQAVPGQEYYAFRNLGITVLGEHDYNRQILLRKGVPPEAIVPLDQPIVNTWDELRAVTRWLEDRGDHTVIIVTSKSHTRRVTMQWRYLKDRAVRAIVRWTPDDPFDPSRAWWKERRFAFIVLWEYLGLINYWLGFPI